MLKKPDKVRGKACSKAKFQCGNWRWTWGHFKTMSESQQSVPTWVSLTALCKHENAIAWQDKLLPGKHVLSTQREGKDSGSRRVETMKSWSSRMPSFEGLTQKSFEGREESLTKSWSQASTVIPLPWRRKMALAIKNEEKRHQLPPKIYRAPTKWREINTNGWSGALK